MYYIATQTFFTILSAFVAAATLLMMQTQYRHVRLLRGLEQEVEENLKAVTSAGIEVFENEDTHAATKFEYPDEIFLTVRSEAPILYVRLARGFSPITRAYRQISLLQTLGPGTQIPNEELESFLSDIERTEADLLQASEKIKEIQRDSLTYRLFNRLWLNENLTRVPGLKAKIMSKNEELDEVIWRPSGMSSHERRKAILESWKTNDVKNEPATEN